MTDGTTPSRTSRQPGEAEVPHISVIVPVLDEAEEIEATLRSAREPEVLEILVVDGGSRDGTVELVAAHGDTVITAPRGRASQMNAGARAARGGVLLFLHGDTRLPGGFGRAILDAVSDGAIGGRFDVDLRGRHWFLPWIAAGMNVRSRLTGISTGDQAIFITRRKFFDLGGFPDIPLMEDVWLSWRLRRAGRTVPLRLRVSTSGRRWEAHGVARTTLLMWRLRLAYALGASPAVLARRYSTRGG